MKNHKPIVSVIVPTLNSAVFLGRCLQSVVQQTYPAVEIIVVDNHSTDQTREIAQRFTPKVFVYGPERCAQVNYGARQATGKYLYYIGSDFVLESTVIGESVEKCEVEDYDAIAVHNASDGTVSFWAKVQALERETYRDDNLIVGARFWRQDIFKKIGGLDEALVAAEDFDLHYRLLKAGAKIGRIKAQELHLGEPHTLGDVWRRGYRYGKTQMQYLKRYPVRGLMQIWPVRTSYLRHWRLFVRHPVLVCALVIMISVKYIGAFCGWITTLGRKTNT